MPRSPGRSVPAVFLAVALLAASAPPVAGQRRDTSGISRGGATARSFALPGWGQRALGQRRSLIYAVSEVGLWVLWANRRVAAAHSRDGYRDLAWEQARLQSGSRQEGAWAYYEAMSKWHTSGAFDMDPARAGVQPEDDPSTFNGSVWKLSRDLYVPPGTTPPESDPAYQRALTYYEAHAYGPAFLWDWSGKDEELTQYKSLIHESDTRFRQATLALGAVLANHLLSGVDAYLSARVPGQASVRVAPPPPRAAGGTGPRQAWWVLVRLRP